MIQKKSGDLIKHIDGKTGGTINVDEIADMDITQLGQDLDECEQEQGQKTVQEFDQSMNAFDLDGEDEGEMSKNMESDLHSQFVDGEGQDNLEQQELS